ncbi:helix-turn-helix transcriptional regulator [Castellaniella sp.]|uniref:helix-turn-helix transcriptional regulator n=1 Tax=Castellaniella sp. TaxID=1955812 RepID=UPI002B0023A9|nr:helix-turn-helix domain-containing protein [Castellaniella sp.]
MTMTSTLTAQFPQPPTSTTLLYRICVAERKLGVSRSTIYRLVNEGQLELIKIGKRSSRITAASLHALIERSKAEH